MKEVKRYSYKSFEEIDDPLYAIIDVSLLYTVLKLKDERYKKWIDIYIFFKDLNYILDYYRIYIKDEKKLSEKEIYDLLENTWRERVKTFPQLKRIRKHKMPIIQKKKGKKRIIAYKKALYDDITNIDNKEDSFRNLKEYFDYRDFVPETKYYLKYEPKKDLVILYKVRN